jgi:uncharacterized C2H2 Zn-finger protein
MEAHQDTPLEEDGEIAPHLGARIETNEQAEASIIDTEEMTMTSPIAKPDPATLKCPECGMTGFKDTRGYGIHRFAKHGVHGSSPATLSSLKRKQEGKKNTVAASKRSYQKKPIPVVAPQGEIAVVVKKQLEIAPIPPAMVGYAMGKLESLAAQIARENELPEQEFVRLVAANLAELTKR